MKLPRYFYIMLAGLLSAAVSSCSSNDEPHPVPPAGDVHRTVLVYMAAANNLGAQHNDSLDIKEMQAGARSGALNGGRLLVYHHGYGTVATLSEIGNDGKIRRIKEYNDGLTSVHGARMAAVIADARKEAPANQFGMVFWSHGDGWLQNGFNDPDYGSPAKAFGQEGAKKMNITTLANVLEQSGDFDFLYFDCCYMSSVEVAYELRHTAPYIVGSQTELPANGMPYDRNLGALFASGEPDLIAAATNTFNHYNSLTGEDRTCTMSVIRTAGLDRLASAGARIFADGANITLGNYVPQKLSLSSSCYFFDLDHYIAAKTKGNAAAYRDEWLDALDDCILYNASTPYLWSRLPLDHISGMSTYILDATSGTANTSYTTLSWYKDVVAAANAE